MLLEFVALCVIYNSAIFLYKSAKLQKNQVLIERWCNCQVIELSKLFVEHGWRDI